MTYTGKVVWVSKNKKFAYIDLKSITGGDLNTGKDVYVHQDDCPIRLRPGIELGFDVVADLRRKAAFRATNVVWIPPPPMTLGEKVFSFLAFIFSLVIVILSILLGANIDLNSNCMFGDGLESSMNEASGYVCD